MLTMPPFKGPAPVQEVLSSLQTLSPQAWHSSVTWPDLAGPSSRGRSFSALAAGEMFPCLRLTFLLTSL